jgi:hypothetical protein
VIEIGLTVRNKIDGEKSLKFTKFLVRNQLSVNEKLITFLKLTFNTSFIHDKKIQHSIFYVEVKKHLYRLKVRIQDILFHSEVYKKLLIPGKKENKI